MIYKHILYMCKTTKIMDKTKQKKIFVKKIIQILQEADERGVPRDDVQTIFNDSTESDRKKFDGNSKKKEIEDTSCTKKQEEKNETKKKKETKYTTCTKKQEEKKNTKWVSVLESKYVMYAFMYVFGVISTLVVYFVYGIIMEALAEKCLINHNVYAAEMSRPLVQCSMCRDLDSIPVEFGISAEEFKQKYAYNSVPVLIKDATNTWSAMTNFSFQFFKNLYLETEDALRTVNEECQFFPYKTDFETLGEVFNMSDERANFSDGEKPWYIGWSNCHREVRNKLREHYERPYFLPNNSESSTTDWIFMGGSGPGAVVHLDYVLRPSWQAQISGMKTWTIIPTPECESECKSFNVTVHKGDIFVVDTNVWYHSTFVHPGEISITIGSEYD